MSLELPKDYDQSTAYEPFTIYVYPIKYQDNDEHVVAQWCATACGASNTNISKEAAAWDLFSSFITMRWLDDPKQQYILKEIANYEELTRIASSFYEPIFKVQRYDYDI
jgi:hypothetical protein